SAEPVLLRVHGPECRLAGDRHAAERELESPGWRERAVHGRLGAICEDERELAAVVCDRNSWRQRSFRRRATLIHWPRSLRRNVSLKRSQLRCSSGVHLRCAPLFVYADSAWSAPDGSETLRQVNGPILAGATTLSRSSVQTAMSFANPSNCPISFQFSR